MKRIGAILASLLAVFLFFNPVEIQAVTNKPALSATESAQATSAAEVKPATPSAFVAKKVVLPKEDITQPTEEVKSKLASFLDKHPIEKLNFSNFLQHGIRQAVKKGIPANTLVLILLFPAVVAVIAAGRHLLGLKGFGIFVPALLSVAFVATGIVVGLVLFSTMLIVAMLARQILKKLKLQYLPRMALMLWFVSIGVLVIVLLVSYFHLAPLGSISIFPILILILLNEKFIETQLGMSKREAQKKVLQTILIALTCSLILNWQELQEFVILRPELFICLTAIFNIFVGKYTGLRLMERWKFRELLK